MLSKNDIYQAKIEDFGCNGEGIARIEGIPVFIPYAAKGEKVRVLIVKAKSFLAYGKLEEIIEQSDKRVSPPCPVYYKCGGCNLQHLEYNTQLEIKGKTVADCLKKIAGIETGAVEVEASEDQYRYRNKLQLPARHTPKGNIIGFFRENSHAIVPINDCPIQREWAGRLISAFKNYLKASGASCYDENTGKGLIRHLVAREAGRCLIVTVVATSLNLPRTDILVKELENIGVFSLFVNLNKSTGNVILGSEFRLIHGKEKISVCEEGLTFSMGPESFMQVNDGVRRKIYSKVCDLLENSGTVIDAYCGAGYLTALIAKKVKRVYGIECVKEAVDCANLLVKENGIDNVSFTLGLCEDVLPKMIAGLGGNDLAVVLDPPRKGCDISVLDALISSSPKKIIYVSCNPSTLARDIGILSGTIAVTEKGLEKVVGEQLRYSIDYIKSYDMFPQTRHVETLAVLIRKT